MNDQVDHIRSGRRRGMNTHRCPPNSFGNISIFGVLLLFDNSHNFFHIRTKIVVDFDDIMSAMHHANSEHLQPQCTVEVVGAGSDKDRKNVPPKFSRADRRKCPAYGRMF